MNVFSRTQDMLKNRSMLFGVLWEITYVEITSSRKQNYMFRKNIFPNL